MMWSRDMDPDTREAVEVAAGKIIALLTREWMDSGWPGWEGMADRRGREPRRG